jgi:hypothetical protein
MFVCVCEQDSHTHLDFVTISFSSTYVVVVVAQVGVVGGPVKGMEVCLKNCLHSVDKEADLLDGNSKPYLTSDRLDDNHVPCLGRGEIVLKGKMVK